MPIDRKFRLARLWSNAELRKLAPLLSGDIVNVSAGDDVDKEGGFYRNYFSGASSYVLTNYSPGAFRGYQGRANEVLLDLRGEVPEELVQRFDVVFNHTTLEHIFEVGTAFRNLCCLSRDLVILVVPFAQVQHENEGYEDFWRFTPTCLRRMFGEEGFAVVYESANDEINVSTYLFFVGSRRPDEWDGRLPEYDPVRKAGNWIGHPDKGPNINRSRWRRFWDLSVRNIKGGSS